MGRIERSGETNVECRNGMIYIAYLEILEVIKNKGVSESKKE
jgi:hypothetical protein